jgi:hypothetical protein
VRLRLWPTLWYRHLWRYALPLSVLLFCCCSCCRCAHALRSALGFFAPLSLYFIPTQNVSACVMQTHTTHTQFSIFKIYILGLIALCIDTFLSLWLISQHRTRAIRQGFGNPVSTTLIAHGTQARGTHSCTHESRTIYY